MVKRLWYISVFIFLIGQASAQSDTLDLPPSDTIELSKILSPDPSFDSIHQATAGPVTVRRIPDSAWQAIRSDEDFWYLQATRPAAREGDWRDWVRQGWVRSTIITVIALAFIGLLLWYLFFSPNGLRQQPDEEGEKEELAREESIFTLDYERLIGRAEREGNYRQGVRLHFLETLRLLSERGLIQYKQDRTNSAYLQQLYGTTFYDTFFRLTRQFEFSWYGHGTINAERYGRLRSDFVHFKKELQP